MRGLVVGFTILLAGCAATSRVASDVTTASLTATQRSVAVMRIGSASPTCRDVAVLLGVAAPATGGLTAYRRHQAIRVANVASVSEPAVAEVELVPGEYHIIGYQCTHVGHKPTTLTTSDGQQLFRSSYAAFTVQPGEIVNVGYLHFGASHVGRSAFGRPFRLEVSVTDWPLADLDRYKARRPELYAQMTTRLMRVTLASDAPAGPPECARLADLRAAGKVQTLPKACS